MTDTSPILLLCRFWSPFRHTSLRQEALARKGIAVLPKRKRLLAAIKFKEGVGDRGRFEAASMFDEATSATAFDWLVFHLDDVVRIAQHRNIRIMRNHQKL